MRFNETGFCLEAGFSPTCALVCVQSRNMDAGGKKRFRWNEQRMLEVLQSMRDNHAAYKLAKRQGTVQDFFNNMGTPYEIAGTVVENMLKNLAKKYRSAVKDINWHEKHGG